MASKTVKRALMGFATGALQATQRHFETQRAQEAERLKEERLAAIRASERAEDRAFQRETFDLQAERELAREERMTSRQIEAEGRQEERAIESEARAEARQRRLLAEQAKYRAPDNPGYVEGDELVNGKRVPFAMRRDEFNALPVERRENMRFRGYYQDDAQPQPSQSAPSRSTNRQQGVDVAPPAPARQAVSTAAPAQNYVQLGSHGQQPEPEPWGNFVQTR